MIYTRWGSEIEILTDCGIHQPDGLNYPSRLLKYRRLEDDMIEFYFQDFLKADNGIHEIISAVEDAPHQILTEWELQQAIKQAL